MSRKISPDSALVAWLRRRDEMIRADMATRINDLTALKTGAEALQEAMEENKHMWNMKDDSVAENPEGVPSQPSARQEQRERQDKRKRETQGGQGGQGGFPKRTPGGGWVCHYKNYGGPALCPDFNKGKCTYNPCRRGKHLCAVQTGHSKVCGGKHGAFEHHGGAR